MNETALVHVIASQSVPSYKLFIIIIIIIIIFIFIIIIIIVVVSITIIIVVIIVIVIIIRSHMPSHTKSHLKGTEYTG